MDEISGENEEISCGDSIFSLLLSVTEEVSDEEAFGEQTAEELAEPLFDLRINRPTAWIEFLKSNEKAIVLKVPFKLLIIYIKPAETIQNLERG